MDIFFQDPNEVPLPPEEVRILDFSAEPYPDQRRIHVQLALTPFQKRPSVEIVILNPAGENISEVSILECMTKNVDLTMHLRAVQPAGSYRIEAVVYYLQDNMQGHEQDNDAEVSPATEPQIVDRGQQIFDLSGS